MNLIEGINKVVEYMEEHLDGEIDFEQMNKITGYSTYHFQRLFMMITGVSVADYIRCRRLSKAAADLQGGDSKVLDVALKYGYSSPNSFNRAFKAMHGVSPSEVKKEGVNIKAFPPLSFELTIKGAETMEYRIEQIKGFRIVGKKLHTTMENGESYRSIPELWGSMIKSGKTNDILALMDGEPMGLLGVSDYNPDFHNSEFDYYIGVTSSKPLTEEMDELSIASNTWAIFPCKNESADSIQKLQHRIVMEWLPTSGYEFAKAPDIERYFADNTMEVWLPVIKVK